jgi:hypothetical protein
LLSQLLLWSLLLLLLLSLCVLLMLKVLLALAHCELLGQQQTVPTAVAQ